MSPSHPNSEVRAPLRSGPSAPTFARASPAGSGFHRSPILASLVYKTTFVGGPEARALATTEETLLADQPRIRRLERRHRIRLHVPLDVIHWAGNWGITDQELRDAIAAVGPIAEDVAAHLGQPLEVVNVCSAGSRVGMVSTTRPELHAGSDPDIGGGRPAEISGSRQTVRFSYQDPSRTLREATMAEVFGVRDRTGRANLVCGQRGGVPAWLSHSRTGRRGG